jgi:hypothetical protein
MRDMPRVIETRIRARVIVILGAVPYAGGDIEVDLLVRTFNENDTRAKLISERCDPWKASFATACAEPAFFSSEERAELLERFDASPRSYLPFDP